MDREGEEEGAVENDCQGGQGSPRAVAPRGRKEGSNILRMLGRNIWSSDKLCIKYYFNIS